MFNYFSKHNQYGNFDIISLYIAFNFLLCLVLEFSDNLST